MNIKTMAQAVGIGMALLAQQAVAQEQREPQGGDGKVVFQPLNISGEAVAAEQAALEKPGAFSSRGADTKLQSLDNVVRGIPGTFTQIDPGQGAISVNIRGLSGYGRVNMMVDGISQNYYGSSPSEVSHGAVPSSQFGALIDPNFIVGVDVSRGNPAGADGINALAGSANFRTIGVDDVVFSGKQYGARSKMLVGSNGTGRSGMLAVAGKTSAFGDGGSVGFMAAASTSSIGASYQNGKGTDSGEFGFGYNQSYKQNPKSQLLKLELKLNAFHSAELAARAYRNKFTRRDIASDDFYIKYNYSPFSELVNLNVTASSGHGNQKFMPGAAFTFINSNTENKSDAIDINNTSKFNLAGGDVSLNYGGKLMRNKYSKHVESLIEDPKANWEAIENNPFGPEGVQKISSLYAGMEFNKGIYQLSAGLNYTSYTLSGYKPACDERVQCFPQGAAHIDLKERGVGPSLLLSADVKPWFQPFFSFAKTMRGPNPQEVFFANDGGASMNPFLKGEKSTTYQLGFHSAGHGLLFKDDALRYKAVYYRSKVDGYISSQSYVICKGGRKCRVAEVQGADGETLSSEKMSDYVTTMYIYTNSTTPVHTSGIELEADYRVGVAYARLSYSKEKTSQPTSIASGWFGAGDISELPDVYYSIDAGVKLLGDKLTLGGIVKHTGNNRRLSPELAESTVTGDIEKVANAKTPVLIDLYGSYQVSKNLFLRLSVQNLMNKDYSEALNRLNSMPSQASENTPANTARSRTYVAGLEYRF
ncbi:TonB-dependent receptor domain-containing protein [Janthinobacterium fluminis]|uniref:TonB-dependent receptor n=1 Tax=Janthinobacterium fluminis TaxID=2987524 RepID=A0ABT5K3F2_9BURK|nr:TonB-dependent receptor [Janthinobacterium fluminis]MDC8759210.1 TonB-dependent receptor [Janthinobacterium fluminis]